MNIVCLVSRQAMPNVLPVLMMKPEIVYLLITEEEKSCGVHLKNLFESKNIKVITREGIDAYNPQTVTDCLIEILQQNEKTSLAINLTGGTKVMSFAAYDFAKEKNISAFYCNTEHQQIINLLPQKHFKKITAEITITDYLLAYGYRIVEIKNREKIALYNQLFDFLLVNDLMNSFLRFNAVIKAKLSISLPSFTVTSSDKNFIFHKNINSYRIEFGKGQRKSFNIEAEDYKSGDWLEYFVYYVLIQKNNYEMISGVKIISDENVENEIDAIVIKDYKLYFVSCKSGKKDNQFDLYQLETIRNIASGTFGKGIFVTANNNSEPFRKRARELQIKIINISKREKIALWLPATSSSVFPV